MTYFFALDTLCYGFCLWSFLAWLNRRHPLPISPSLKKLFGFKSAKQLSEEEQEEAVTRRQGNKERKEAGVSAIALVKSIYSVFCENELTPDDNSELILYLIKKSIIASPDCLLNQLNVDTTPPVRSRRGRSQSPATRRIQRAPLTDEFAGSAGGNPIVPYIRKPSPIVAPTSIAKPYIPLKKSEMKPVPPEPLRLTLFAELKGTMMKRKHDAGDCQTPCSYC